MGVGVDILQISRMKDVLARDSQAFLSRVYSEAERHEAAERPNSLVYFATRFAGKEAVLKCFQMDFSESLQLNEIEILNEASGRPFVTLHGKFRTHAVENGIKTISLSLSYDGDYAIAFAMT